jgi:hypothetical protein
LVHINMSGVETYFLTITMNLDVASFWKCT